MGLGQTLGKAGLGFARAHPWRAAAAFCLSSLLILDQIYAPPLPRAEPGMLVLASDGTPLRAWPDVDGLWRMPTTELAVSPLYVQALLAYEDRWFYWHPGVNPFALLRAVWQWLSHGEIVSGGSTLSMQAARTIEPIAHNWRGKLHQIARALQLELRLSKSEILTLYLNHAPMGGMIEGVEMASKSYLGKTAAHLSAAEAALLVVLPQAPSRLRPDRHPERAQVARDKVLLRMHGVWLPEMLADARQERVAAMPPRLAWLAPLAAERLHQRAKNQARQSRQAYTSVRSTIDRDVQSMLERILADKVGQLPRFVSMAALVVDSQTMHALAYAGSADFSDQRRFAHVDMVRGIRSPGSTLKPFLYGLALDLGLIHSESLLADTPQSFGGYDPGNFQANFVGPVSVSEALQRSLNVPAVDLLERIGSARFAAQLSNAGVRLRMPATATPNLSLILGGVGTNLEELVGAYRAFALHGKAGRVRLTADETLHEVRILSPGAAYIIRQILEAGGNPEYAFVEGNPTRLAWKTGTSYGFRDAWAVGVVGGYTLGVWIGRPDGTPNPGFFGANIAAPVLHQIAQALPARGLTAQVKPESVSVAQICWPLGGAVATTKPEHCHQQRTAWVLHNTLPPTLPDRLRSTGLLEQAWFDPGTGVRTSLTCTPDAQPRTLAHWPALLEHWLTPDLRLRYGLRAEQSACAPQNSSTQLRLLGMNPGGRLRALPGQTQVKLGINAVGGTGKLYWLQDGKFLSLAANQAQFIFTQNGWHGVTVLDGGGQHAHLEFWVEGLPAPTLLAHTAAKTGEN